MHEKSNQESTDPRPDMDGRNVPTTEREDIAIQRAVLALVFDQNPNRLSRGELRGEMVADPADFAQVDALDRAVGDLVGAGLLRRKGDLVLPTRAAIHFDRLESA